MSDIVERLRSATFILYDGSAAGRVQAGYIGRMLNDSADEIERLRGLLKRGFAFAANCEADPDQPEAFRDKARQWDAEVRDALSGQESGQNGLIADQPDAAP